MKPADSPQPRHNLPAQLTTLVGRNGDLAEVKRLLESHRLVTLTGAGGVGKTRIALSVAADVASLDAYPDGVWLVELAGLTDSRLIPQAVARALRAQESPGQSAEETVADALTGRHLVLVMDNCEHLIDACARLIGRLLSNSPELRVLATSREALGIPGEIAWSVPSLSVPATGISSLPALADCASVQLVVERAGAAAKDFGLTRRNAAAVASICRRLDGIPLALELAAARLAVLTPEQLAQRLGDIFPLLAGGSRTADPRQQTLRATVDWSYQLLSELERTLFRRCAVFVGGWSIDAAEAVCVGEPIEASDVLDLTAQLVSKSLLVAEEHGATQRYRMLEPIRQFAAEQLFVQDAAAAVRNRHLTWLVEMSEQAEAGLWGPEQHDWLQRLEAEHENVRAALEWSQGTGQAEAMLRLAAALARFWDVHGYLTEGSGWLAAALEATGSLRTLSRAQALTRAAYLDVLRNALSEADVYLPEALALAQQLGDEEAIGAAFLVMGMCARARGEYHEAAAKFELSLEMSRRANHRPGVYTSLYLLASAARFSGDYARAITLHEESLALKREQGDAWGVAASLFSLGTLARVLGDARRATALYRDSLSLRRQLSDRMGICVCLEALAGLATDPVRAAVLLGAAERLREAIGPVGRALARTDQVVEPLRSALGPERFATYWARGRELDLDQVINEVLMTDAASDAKHADGMSGAPPSPPVRVDDEFGDLVDDALKHLNDAPALRHHPLRRFLPSLISPDLAAAEAGAQLRAELLQAIERLRPNTPRPSPGARAGAGAWLHHLILHESYVVERGNSETMLSYNLSETSFYRARKRAVAAVAEDLVDRDRTASPGAISR